MTRMNLIETVLIKIRKTQKDKCLRGSKEVKLIAAKNKTVVLRGWGREGQAFVKGCQTSDGQKISPESPLTRGRLLLGDCL